MNGVERVKSLNPETISTEDILLRDLVYICTLRSSCIGGGGRDNMLIEVLQSRKFFTISLLRIVIFQSYRLASVLPLILVEISAGIISRHPD